MKTMSLHARPASALAISVLALTMPQAASAQPALYSNGSTDPNTPALSTGPTTASGVPAPGAGLWSEIPSDSVFSANAVSGFSVHTLNSLRAYQLADDFTVPATGGGWLAQSVSFYAYHTGSPGSLAPFANVRVSVWSGRPGNPGATRVYTSPPTPQITASLRTGIFRTFSTVVGPFFAAPDSSREIWRLDVQLGGAGGLELSPGTYWLDWSIVPATTNTEVFAPPVTKVGVRGIAGANARHYRTQSGLPGQWVDLADAGKPAAVVDVAQELPFIVRGTFVPPPCRIDYNNDGEIDFSDMEGFLSAYNAQTPGFWAPGADLNEDLEFDFADVERFVQLFNTGC